MRHFPGFLVIGWMTAATVVFAAVEDFDLMLPPLVVSASRIPTRLEEMPATITVISADDLAAAGAGRLTEVLALIPGIHVSRPGGKGGLPVIYLRGGEDNHSLILVDGVKVNDPTDQRGGVFNLDSVDPRSVERLEIIAGPFSSRFGSDAIGGVINIITRPPAGWSDTTGERVFSTELVAATGGDGLYNGSINMKYASEQLDFSLHGGHGDDGNALPGNSFSGTDLQASAGIRAGDRLRLEWTARYATTAREGFPDDSGGSQLAVFRDLEGEDARDAVAGMTIHFSPGRHMELRLATGYYNGWSDVDSPGVAPGLRDPVGVPPSTTENDFTRYHAGLDWVMRINRHLKMSAGVELEEERGDSKGMLDYGGYPLAADFTMKRDICSPFMEFHLDASRGLALHGGIRMDTTADLDPEYSPRIGVVWSPGDTGFSVRAAWSEGFKLPSFYALGNPLVGNPDLKPETSSSYEVGVNQSLPRTGLSLSATLFSGTYHDIIDFDPGPPPVMVNRDQLDTRGIEASLAWTVFGGLSTSLSATYVESEFEGSDQAPLRRPDWRGAWSLRWVPVDAWLLRLDTVYVGETWDSSIPTGDIRLDDYLRTDLAVSWRPASAIGLELLVENLTDTNYQEAIGFPAPGIRPRLQIAWSL
ncbi:TonB-dependent receptor [bacterium]|nr:TonB-dependent receptor [candidate division CSSED10-310 bacterium]